MDRDLLKKLEEGLICIGDKISGWRDDVAAREILEPSAFKTNADLKADSLIKDLIFKFFPGAQVFSEEDTTHIAERPTAYWLIDPIDGTASWYGGFDGFVTQIAYIEQGIPIYGAVYAPVLKKLWSASKGNGAWLNGRRLPKLEKTSRLNLIDNYPQPRRIAKKISAVINLSNYIECGSLGLKSCFVVDGTADLFVKDVVIRDWDIAPIAVLISEVGGVLCDLNGEDISFIGKFEKEHGLIVARDLELSTLIVGIANAEL